MRQHLHVLVLGDRSADADLLVAQLRAGGYECDYRRADDGASFSAALAADVDLILADYSLARYTAPLALAVLKERALDIPFIVVTAATGEEKAVECLRHGATDYLLKDRLARLPDAVARALEDRRGRDSARATHKALLESEARFRRLAENAQDIIFRYRLASPQGFEYVSPAATAITGYTPEEHYRDPMLGLKLAHPDDRWMLEAARTADVPVEAPLEMRWIRKDGAVVWTEQRFRAIRDDDGAVVAVEGIARDITDRKESERSAQLAAQVLERVTSLVLVADEYGDIKYASPSVERLLGFTREEVLGTGWWRLSRAQPESSDAERGRLAATARGADPCDGVVYERAVVDKQGRWHWFEWEDRRGPGNTIVGVGHDVTERRRAEEERRELIQNLAERVNEATLLHHAARLLHDSSRSLGTLLREIVNAMPAAWRYPHKAVARVRLAHVDVCSPGYLEAPFVDRVPLGAEGDFIEVRYLDAGEFLPEEHAVLRSLGEMLTAHLHRRNAEQQLAGSEAKYRALIEHMPAVTYVAGLTPAQPAAYMSPRIESLLGWPPDRFLKDPKAWQNCIHPDDREQVIAEFTGLSRRGGTTQTEYRMLHRDGRVVWVRDEATLVQGPANDRLCVQGVMFDITDRKRVEEALQTSRRALQTVIDASPFPIIEVDGSLKIKLWNPAAERLFGWTADEVIGRDNPAVPSEYAEEYRASWQRAASGEVVVRQTRRRRKDGELVDVLLSVAAIRDAEGRPTSTVGMFADISDRMSAEARLRDREEHFRSLIENALDIIAVVDPSGVITYVSPSVQALLGYPESDLIGTRSFDWFHPDDQQAAADALAGVRGAAAEQRLLTVRFRHADGRWRSLEMKLKGRRDPDRDTFVIINARDITDREGLEQQLRQSQKLEAIGRLAGGVAHDFNNLLTAILGYGELMLDRIPEGSDLRGDLTEILKAGERAGALTHQLLAFSRKQILQPQRLSLNTVIADFQKMLGRVIGEDVELTTRLSPAIGVVHADRGQLEQVLLNLAVNGRDAMPRGGTLTVETSALDVAAAFTDGQVSLERGRWVCMAVTDTGCGMAPDLVARVFEPFFTTKGPGKGTGLGLSTVYGIVAQSGGHIALDSCVGHGTTFRMYLPEVSQASVAPTVPARPDGRKSGTETILLVEDERGIRKLIRIALERHGYTVLEAASGEQALASAREHQGGIHLLLSDIVMPGMSGVDLAQHLIVERPALKVMHMSGFAVAAHAGKLSPNVTFLQKPFTVEALTRQVRRCLDSGASGGVVQK